MTEAAKDLEPEEIDEGNQAPVVAKVSEDEQKASGNGWTDREAWESTGGDPDNWVSAKKFNERGEMIGKIRSLEKRMDGQQKDFGARLDSQKKLHEAQLKVTISDLESKRDDAIDLADRDKANAIQGQIDDVRLQTVVEPAEEDGNNVVDDWNADNPWVFENTPKAAYAQSRFNTYSQQGQAGGQAIAAMEADVAREFPKTNARRDNAPAVEGGRSKPGSRPPAKLAWSQLTADELKWYGVMPGAWKNKDDYLKAVADERKS